MTITPVKSKTLSVFPDTLSYGFFTRNGGVGNGLYQSLNVSLASNDDRDTVTENRVRCALHLGVNPEKLVTLAQCHSDCVIPITDEKNLPHNLPADALVTNLSGIAIGVQTADCAPILFYAPQSNIIAATHAGWQGAFKDIHIRTVETMVRLGADVSNIIAVIGPCMHQESFEVGDDFYHDFINKSSDNERFFNTDKGRYHFDNAGFIASGLEQCGIKSVESLPLDTYTRKDMFFSFRRATHKGEPDYGRQLSAIVLK